MRAATPTPGSRAWFTTRPIWLSGTIFRAEPRGFPRRSVNPSLIGSSVYPLVRKPFIIGAPLFSLFAERGADHTQNIWRLGELNVAAAVPARAR
jgi:hypothetical protein